MGSQKFYVVWRGRRPGVYATWSECKENVEGFEGAKYRSFASQDEATSAFREADIPKASKTATPLASGPYLMEALAVDAACSGNPGPMEYRGVWIGTREEMFRVGPLEQGTNNIGEFLALVHGLALCQKNGWSYPIYSDSVNAMSWVRQKRCKTKLEPSKTNQVIFEMIERAEQWLNSHQWSNKIIKWQTKQWGEIPADFGRK